MTIGVVVVAAGAGTRLGTEVPKAVVEVAGRSLLAHSLAGLAGAGLPPAVVVHPEGRGAELAASTDTAVAAWVSGGATRTQSVRAGVAALPSGLATVVVHDAARPLVPVAVIRAVVAAVTEPDEGLGTTPARRVVAAAPAVPVADTLKRVSDDTVLATVDRTDLVGVQTPQVFDHEVLELALAAGEDATDELALVESLTATGRVRGRVAIVSGSAWARKVTDRGDLAVVEALARTPPPGETTR